VSGADERAVESVDERNMNDTKDFSLLLEFRNQT
jgi:hypothetical protein